MQTNIIALLLLTLGSTLAANADVLTITDCTLNNSGGRTCKFPWIDLQQSKIQLRFEDQESSDMISCVQSRKGSSKSWHGECAGQAADANFLQVTDPNGLVSIVGSIHIDEEVCQVGLSSEGDLELECTPDHLFGDEWEVEDDEIEGEDDLTRSRSLQETGAVFAMAKSNNLRRGRRLYADDGKHLDVMIVWTKEAECGYSQMQYPCSLSATTEFRMRSLIELAVQETDDAFSLSGIDAKIRVVHAYRHETYVEPTSNVWNTLAAQLRSGNDGKMDDVHAKRVLYGADVVHMIAGSKGSCGVGYVGPNIWKAFSVSRFSCATGYFSFGHEIAHNLGAHHDRGTMRKCDSETTFNHGFKDPDSEFRSIMSYDCSTNQCDNLAKGGCKRVQRFSNKNLPYNGKAMGDAMNDNARVITENLKVVAKFFPAMDCRQDSDCDDNDTTTSNKCNLANNACVFKKEVQTTTKPTMSPTKDMSQYGNLGFLETIVVPSVSISSWKTVNLSSNFVNPVVKCSVKYNGSTTLMPTVVRMTNVSGSSFQVRLQSPSGITSISARNLHCLIVEQGAWELPDGRPIEARTFQSSETDTSVSWVGERQSFQNSYSTPVVVGQVMSYNDPKWSVFWSRGANRNTCADQDNFFAGKHVGQDPIKSRGDETIGYIVMEAASHGIVGGMEFDVGQGDATVAGYTQGNYLLSYTSSFASGAPEVTITSQCKMVGIDGSWAVLTTDATDGAMGVAVDEDRLADTERNHAPEALNFMAFSSQGQMNLIPFGSAPEPTKQPTAAPTKQPTAAPTKQPTAAPTSAPTDGPTKEEFGGFMESKLARDVDSNVWTTVQLTASFTLPVPVCSVKYDSGTSLPPALVRMRNVQASSFEVRLQNPSSQYISGRDVHCVIVESGVWTLPNGDSVEAFQYLSTVTDHSKNSWRGEPQTFSTAFAVPVILGQVLTFNDERSVSFWSRGATRFDHAEYGSAFYTGKHIAEDSGLARGDETVGVIVMEASRQNGSVEVEAARSSTGAAGYIEGASTIYTFAEPFNNAPEVTVVSQPQMGGADGSWPVLTSDATKTSFGVAVDEDQVQDNERWHLRESLDYVAFSQQGTVGLVPGEMHT